LRLDHGNLPFRLSFPLQSPSDLGVRGEHFRAAVIDLGDAESGIGRQLLVARQAAFGVGQEDLVLLVLGGQCFQGRLRGGEFGLGLPGNLGQPLHFRSGLSHFRLGLSDRRVQLAMIQLRDDVPLLDKLRLGHVQLGQPPGELRGQHRLPVRDDIACGRQFRAAVRRFARRGRNPGGGRDADFRNLQAPHQARRQDRTGKDDNQDHPHPGRHPPPAPGPVDFQRRQAIRRHHQRSAHARRRRRPSLQVQPIGPARRDARILTSWIPRRPSRRGAGGTDRDLPRHVGRNKSAQFRKKFLRFSAACPCRNCGDLFRPTFSSSSVPSPNLSHFSNSSTSSREGNEVCVPGLSTERVAMAPARRAASSSPCPSPRKYARLPTYASPAPVESTALTA